jgi:hypothetical protein
LKALMKLESLEKLESFFQNIETFEKVKKPYKA